MHCFKVVRGDGAVYTWGDTVAYANYANYVAFGSGSASSWAIRSPRPTDLSYFEYTLGGGTAGSGAPNNASSRKYVAFGFYSLAWLRFGRMVVASCTSIHWVF